MKSYQGIFIFVCNFFILTQAQALSLGSFNCNGMTETPGIFQRLEYSKYRPEYVRKFLIDKIFNRTQISEDYKIESETEDAQFIILKGRRTMTKLGQGSRIEFELKVSKSKKSDSRLTERLYFVEGGQGVWSDPNLHNLKCEFR